MVIYDNTGTVLLDIEVDDTSVRYKAIKGENSLMLKFSLDEHIEIPLGSYCLFKGEMYSLMLPEDLTLKHRRDFEYSLMLYGDDAKSRRYKFRNPVDRRLKFSLTAKPKEHLQMFVDNMNMRDSGWSVGECPDQAEVVLSYNHTFCHDALVQLADELKLDYWYDGKVVNLGKLELNKDNPLPLSYGGDGDGLKEDIKRTNYADALPIEVLYVQGTATNIDASKYGASELHLPKSQTIGFDGTYFEDEAGYNEKKARLYKTDGDGFSLMRADKEIANHSEDSLDCSNIEPAKEETVISVIEVNKAKHFYDILFESNVDYSNYVIEGENATIVFQSGMLAGKEFDLATDTNGNLICKQYNGKWRVEIVPQDIDGITMPDAESGYLPVTGDTFKVFGIQLPDEYISDNETKSGAEWNMLRYAVKYLYSNEDVQYSISGTLDEIYAKRNWDSIKDKITLGGYISFSDKSFQAEPLLIRIIGIKEYVNKPYSPQLEISNATLSGTLVGTLNRIENQEVQTEDMFREAIGFTKRRWRDTKETISMLQGAIDGFTEGINPVTVETMTMLVGDERLQFILTDSLTSDTHAELLYDYDAATGTFSVESAYIKHMTLGIDSISPVHTDDEYKRWSVSGKSEVLESESGYYLYAKVSKSNATGSFELPKTTLADDDDWYYLLVGIINSEYGGDRSFASMYGFTEVRPGQITTDNIRSADGNTWLDLLKGVLHLNNMAGVSGVKTEEKGDQSIAAWFGGLMKDIELDDDKENAAKSVIRHDGTGYFANGLFKWDKHKGINLGNDAIKVNYDGSVDFGDQIRIGASGDETLGSLLTIVATLSDMWSIDDDGNLVTDKQVIIKNNLVVHGDQTAGGEGSASVGIQGIIVNGVTYRDTDGDGIIDLGEITGGGSTITEITSAMVVKALGYTPYDASNPNGYITASALGGYATQSWVEGKGYITATALNGYITESAVNSKLAGYLPLTGGTINGVLTINPTNASGVQDGLILKDSGGGRNEALRLKWISTSYTTGNSIYPDSAYENLIYNNGTNAYTLIHSGNIGSQKVAGLATARTIWGQPFDGTGNITGSLQLNNGIAIYVKNTSGSFKDALKMSSSDNFMIGFGVSEAGHNTYLEGNNIYLRYGQSHSSGFILNSSGNVGIGTTSPAYKLDVAGTVRATGGFKSPSIGIECDADGNTTGYGSEINRFGSNLYLQGREGNLYLSHSEGTTFIRGLASITGAVTMASTLSVSGAVSVLGTNLVVSATGNAGSGGAGVMLHNEGGIEISHATTPFIDFHYANATTDYTTRLMLGQNKELKLIDGHFLPGISGSYSLGSSSLRWNILWIAGINTSGNTDVGGALTVGAGATIKGNLVVTGDISA